MNYKESKANAVRVIDRIQPVVFPPTKDVAVTPYSWPIMWGVIHCAYLECRGQSLVPSPIVQQREVDSGKLKVAYVLTAKRRKTLRPHGP